MKNKIKLSLSVLASIAIMSLAFLTPGCSTTGGNTGSFINVNTNTGLVSINGTVIDTNSVYAGLKTGTLLGVNAAIRADTNSVVYFQGVDLALTVLLNNQQLNPNELTAALNSVNISQLKNPNTAAFMETGVSLYESFYGELVANNIQNLNVYLIPALNGIQQGIEASLKANNALP